MEQMQAITQAEQLWSTPDSILSIVLLIKNSHTWGRGLIKEGINICILEESLLENSFLQLTDDHEELLVKFQPSVKI